MGNDISSIINLGQSIATTPIKIIVETSHDTSQPLISTLSLNPTKQTWSELCRNFITYDYPSSCNTRLLNLLKDIYPTARLSTYKIRFHNGYCTIIKPKWSSNYDIDIPRIDAYVDVNISFCDINNPKRFGPYDTIANSLLRGMDRNSTPEEQAARLRRPRVNLQITKLYGMENDELDVDCTPYPIYKELTKVLYVTERDEYQGYCEDIQVKDVVDGNVMGYKRLFPKICKEQQIKRVDVSDGNDVEMKETDTERIDAIDTKPKVQEVVSKKDDESSSSSDSSESESEDEEETNQSMVKKMNEPKKEDSLADEKVAAINKDESSSSSSDSDSESEDEEEAKQSSTKENDASSPSSSDSDSSDSSDSEEEEEVNVKNKQTSKEATNKEDDNISDRKPNESSSSSSSSSSDSSDSEDENPVPTKKDSSSEVVPKASPSKQVAPTDKVSPQQKKVSPQKKTDVAQSKQSKSNNKMSAKKKQRKATEPKKPTSIQDTKVPAKSKNKRKREQNATKQAFAESEKGDKSSLNNAGDRDQPKKKRKKANIMTGRYAKEIAAKSAAAKSSSTTNGNKKKSTTPKKKQDPNEPRRPKNGFYLYCDSVREQLTAQNPGLPAKDIQVLMRKEYKSLSKSQLSAWKEVAKEAFGRYRIELEAYEKTLKKDD